MSERELFLQALDIKDPADRAVFVDQACADQPDLRRQVEQLLKAHELAGEFLNHPHPAAAGGEHTGAYVSESRADEKPGTVIAGKYKLLQRIGDGGMGSVWMADQLEPVKRRVAIKLIRAERDGSRTILSRFEAERQAIALMDHPNIAKLLDAGTAESPPPQPSPIKGEGDLHSQPGEPRGFPPRGEGFESGDGRPYFVMELVKGIPLTEFCDEHKLSIPERLNLFMQICGAVQHAHQKGIIHRDLKPTNILVEMHDDKPVPKVIDFGLAKALSGQPLTEHTLFTGFGTVAGTPLYMAPEQAKFNAIDIDTRADIYALGVILYELLTGGTPIERATLKQAALDEILRVIRESEPPTPSKRLSLTESKPSIAACRQMEPVKLGRFVKGELDWIVMKALAKERDRRYETANGFARDVERFLNHEPVLAGPPSARYRLRKFVRRNKGPVLAATTILVVLLGGVAASMWQAVRAMRAEAQIKQEKEQTDLALQWSDYHLQWARYAVDHYLQRVTDNPELKHRGELHGLRKELLQAAIPFFEDLVAENSDNPDLLYDQAVAYHWLGLIREEQGEVGAALKDYEAARDIYQRLSNAYPTDARYLYGIAASHGDLADIWSALGETAKIEASLRISISLFQQLVERYPNEPSYALAYSKTQNRLGQDLHARGRLLEAEVAFRDAIRIQEKLLKEYPKDADHRTELARTRYNLGRLLHSQGNLAGQEAAYRESLAAQQKLMTDFPNEPDHRKGAALNLEGLAGTFVNQGRFTEAKEMCQQAGAIDEKLVSDFPYDPLYRSHLAWDHWRLGTVLSNLGQQTEAKAAYDRALAIQEKLALDFPEVPRYRGDLAQTLKDSAELLDQQGRSSESEAIYRRALAILEKLTADGQSTLEHRRELANAYAGLGTVLSHMQKFPEAEAFYARAIASHEKLVADRANISSDCDDLVHCYLNVGLNHAGQEHPSEALQWYDKALALLDKSAAQDQLPMGRRRILRDTLWARAIALGKLNRHAEAITNWSQAIKLTFSLQQSAVEVSQLLNMRLRSLLKEQKLLAAVETAAKMKELAGNHPDQLYNAACGYSLCAAAAKELVANAPGSDKLAEEALALLKQALAKGYKDGAHMKQDKDLDGLRDRSDFQKLLAELEAGSGKR